MSDAVPATAPVRLPPLARFGVVFRWGLLRGLRATRFRVAFTLVAVLGAGLGYLTTHNQDPAFHLWKLLDGGLLGIGVPLLALSLVGSGYGEEVQEQTLVYHLVRPVSRSTVFLARYVSGAVPGMLAAAVIPVAAALAAGSKVGGPALASLALVGAIGAATVGAVYYALAALFRRGLVAGLAYTFIAEGLFQFLPGGIQRLSLMHHVRSLLHRWTDDAFAKTSTWIASAVERTRDVERGATDAAGVVFRRAERERWTSTTNAILICAGVIVAALVIGARAVSKKDYALKE